MGAAALRSLSSLLHLVAGRRTYPAWLSGKLTLAFDVTATLGAATFLSGLLVSRDGAAIASYHADPNWPVASRLDAMSLLANPGSVPGNNVNYSLLTPGGLQISWMVATPAGAGSRSLSDSP